MNALIGERDEISLVCYFVRCCINTVIGRPCYGGLALYMGKMDGRKKGKQKHRGTAVYSSLHSLTSDCCDSSPICSFFCLLSHHWSQCTGVHKQQTGKPSNSADAVLSSQSIFGMVHVCERCSEGEATALQPCFYLCPWSFRYAGIHGLSTL